MKSTEAIDNKKNKKNVIIIALSVLILTLITLNLSYSAFFSVDSKSEAQEISTGTLNVTASVPTILKSEEVYPTEETLPTGPKSSLSNSDKDCASLVITNNGNIDANYVVSLSYDTTGLSKDQIAKNMVSWNYLIIGIYDADSNSWLNLNPNSSGQAIYNMPVNQFTPSSEGVYPILKGEIAKAKMDASGSTPVKKNLKIYVWLSDITPESEIGKLMHLKVTVKSTPTKGQKTS